MTAFHTLNLYNQKDSQDYSYHLLLAKLGATLTKKTAKAFLCCDFVKFDALSRGDRGCQFRGYLVSSFAGDSNLKKEAEAVYKSAENVEKALVKLKNTTDDAHLSFNKLSVYHQLDINLSEKMQFLLLSHVLTITADNTRREGGIRKSNPKQLIRIDKGVVNYPLLAKKIVAAATQSLSALSVKMLQAEFPKNVRQLACLKRISIDSSEIEVSCLLVNIRAIMKLAKQKGLVIQLQTQHQQLFYRGGTTQISVDSLSKGTPLMVIQAEEGEGFNKLIDSVGLKHLLECAASLEPQFGSLDDPQLIEELGLTEKLKTLRSKAKKLGLKAAAEDGPSVLSIKHFIPDSVK